MSYKDPLVAEKRRADTNFKVSITFPQVSVFVSDLRQRNREGKETLLKLYTSSLNKTNKSVFIPQPEAFMKAVFLDEKTKFKKNKLLHWYKFTDPTSTLAILVYNGIDDPFASFYYNE